MASPTRLGYIGYVIKIGLLIKFALISCKDQKGLDQVIEGFLSEAFERENKDFTKGP